MKLILCLLIFFIVEVHNSSRKSPPSNVIRIPLTTRVGMKKHISANARMEHMNLIDDFSTVGKISIGKPNQNFSILFDTGSFDMWVYSNEYEICDQSSEILFKKQRSLYKHAASSEFQQPRSRKGRAKAQLILYVTDWVFGFKAIDIVTIQGQQIEQEFLEVTKATTPREQSLLEGLIGLRYHPIYGNIVTKICDGINGERKFSYYLPKVRILGTAGQGEMIFCGENKSKYKEDTMHYVTEIDPGKWHISVESAVMESIKGSKTLSGQFIAVIDTGTNQLVGTEKGLKKFFADLDPYLIEPPVLSRKVGCDFVPLLPNITFEINTKKFTITAVEYTHRFNKGSNSCYVAVDVVPKNHGRWILGEPFIRKYYTIFDMQKNRIGLAESKG